MIKTLNLAPGQRVLDLGCGAGGAAISMAQNYGVHVHGVDISTNMIKTAKTRLDQQKEDIQDLIHFEIANITEIELDPASFDAIYSREALMYIDDKESFFKKIQSWLRPGGKLYVTFFCRGTSGESFPELENDIKFQRWGTQHTTAECEEYLRKAAFSAVTTEDKSNCFDHSQQKTLQYLIAGRERFIQEFGENDYAKLVKRIENQMIGNQRGVLQWGVFRATK
ncbi:uncharacterized protein LOC143036636 [Oratosquilla oratoria]|uniref:uncharacterized protein LOC143036636 n=1 Tax=Oratosquilla oratoria TaxID=337810 RepID=UPI003F7776AC